MQANLLVYDDFIPRRGYPLVEKTYAHHYCAAGGNLPHAIGGGYKIHNLT
jgi:hypothetical protein